MREDRNLTLEDRCQTGGIPGGKRVQAPLAPGFYRSCADALTDGFRPQSGLVQRGVCMPPVGSSPFGGWRHHLCHGVKRVTGFSVTQGLPTNPVPLPPLFRGHYGCWAACQFEFMTVTERKPYNRASPEEMHPFWCCAPLPPEGEVCSPLSCLPHKHLKAWRR